MVEAIVKRSCGEEMKTKTITKTNLTELIRKEILSWEGVSEKKSSYSFVKAFFVNGKEFAHFHSENEMDVNSFAKVPESFFKNKNIKENHYSGNWFIYIFETEKDVEELLELIKQSFEKVKK